MFSKVISFCNSFLQAVSVPLDFLSWSNELILKSEIGLNSYKGQTMIINRVNSKGKRPEQIQLGLPPDALAIHSSQFSA